MAFLYPVFILFLLAIPVFWFRMKTFDSVRGVALIGCIVSAIAIRTFLIKIPLRIFDGTTVVQSCVAAAIITLFSFLCLVPEQKYRNKNTLLLFLLYLVSGFIQQLFFQYVVLDVMLTVLPVVPIAVCVSAFYYAIYHAKHNLKFAAQSFLIGIMWAVVYLAYHNIVPLGISHAIIGTIYFTRIYRKNIIAERSAILKDRVAI